MAVDLFTPMVPRDRWHPNFVRLLEHAFEDERQVLRGWTEGFVDRDGKFVIEFQTTFNSSFWELYLFALWRDLGCRCDQRFPRPDFVITGGALGAFVAEAVTTSNAAGGTPEWAADPLALPDEREDLLDLASLRLSQAITEKHRKWRDEYQGLPQCADQPFLVCVAPFDQPWTQLQGTQAIDRVLFGGPRPVLVTDDGGTQRVLGRAETREAFKKSGARVELGLFTTDRFADVSAVVFSSMATWTKVHALSRPAEGTAIFQAIRFSQGQLGHLVQDGSQYRESLVDGAQLFLNPFAQRRFDPEPWFKAAFAVHCYSPTGTETALPDGALVMRTAMRMRVRGPNDPPVLAHAAPPGARAHVRQPPPDGVFFGGPGQLGTVDSIELMLYKGWTLYVGRDSIDGDWCSLGKLGTHLSIEEFNKADDEQAFMGRWVGSRDDAAADAQSTIDGGLPIDDSDSDDD